MVDARRAVGAVSVACLLALAGCTADDPSGPTPSPTPVVQTPTETAQERQQRLDYAAAEKAYRTFRAEYNRVLRAGGAKEPTKVMKATAGGNYLSTFVEVTRGYKLLGSRDVGEEKVIYARGDGYGSSEVLLSVCEDSRAVTTVRKSGKNSRGELRTAKLKVRKVGERWLVWSGTGKRVGSCA